MNYFNPRNVKIGGFIVVALVAILGIFVLIVPLVADITNPAEVTQQQAANKALQTQVDQLNTIRQQAPEINKIRAQLIKQFPSSANVPELVTLISAAAQSSGIPSSQITNFAFTAPTLSAAAGTGAAGTKSSTSAATPAPASTSGTGSTTTSSSYASLGVNLTVKGSQSQFAKFMDEITSLSRVFSINNFSISLANGNGSVPGNSVASLPTLTMSGTTFLYQTPAVPGTATTTAPNAAAGSANTATGSGTTATTAPTPITSIGQ